MALPSLKNRVGMSVSSVASAGTGAYTLNAALADHQSFATAYGANAVVSTVAVEAGVGWEIARDATYTHSGTTLSRGTLEASSTGSAVAFSSAVEVYVIQTAGEALQSQYRSTSHTVTTANIDLVLNAWNYCTIAGLTADRDALLPATFAEGDWVGVHILDGDADYELLLKPNTGDTINSGSAGAEWSRLFIAGERVVFRCTTANSAWAVEQDGRTPMHAMMERAAAQTISHNTLTKLAFDAEIFDIGNVADPTTNNRFNIRRAGRVDVSGLGNIANADADSRVVVRVYKNGTFTLELTRSFNRLAAGTTVGSGAGSLTCAAGDYLELWELWSVGGGSGTKDTETQAAARPYMAITEVI